MTNEEIIRALEFLPENMIEDADQFRNQVAERKTAWHKWCAAAAACVALMAGILGFFSLKTPEEPASNDAGDGPSYVVVDDTTYMISPHLVSCRECPKGFSPAGTIEEGGNEEMGCKYYVNSNLPYLLYVYRMTNTDGTVDENNTIIQTDFHMAYVQYVESELRGKNFVRYQDQLYVSLWTAGHADEAFQTRLETYEAAYGRRIEGTTVENFTEVGKTTFAGYDLLPTGELFSNTHRRGEAVYANAADYNVILVETEWYTATEEEDGETKHTGFDVYILWE